jgi:predicted ATPase
MIERVRIQNYKALRDVTLELTPIHVLIGPNDSGKSSIFEAIAALCRSVDHPLAQAFTGAWQGRELVWQQQCEIPVELTASVSSEREAFDYSLGVVFGPSGRTARTSSEYVRIAATPPRIEFGATGSDFSRVCQIASRGNRANDQLNNLASLVFDSLLGIQLYRWDSRYLSLPVAPDKDRRFRMEPSGFGLALCLDDILGYDRDSFIELERRFTDIFPHIKSIKLMQESAYKSPADDPEQIETLHKSDGKGIHFELVGGATVRARQMSDGVLLVLAYLAVMHLPKPPRMVLVEEPENGIHPKRLRDVLSILRSLVGRQSQTQIVMTTHSPYLVDLFEPMEVTLCQKQADGSVAVHRLSESKAVRQQLDVFSLGEIWTAEGDEALAEAAAAAGAPAE